MTRKSTPSCVVELVDRADVRVVQARDRSGFALEAFLEIVVAGHVARDDFDGDGAIDAGVLRAAHLAHTAAADGGFDFVRPQA